MAERLERCEIEALKANADLVGTVSRWVPLRRVGRELRGPCPWCGGDRTASRFRIYAAGNLYQCFACGEDGDILSFLCRREDFSFSEAIRRLRNQAPLPRRKVPVFDPGNARQKRIRDINRALGIFFNARPPQGTVVETYLHSRGIRIQPSFSLRFAAEFPFWWTPKHENAGPIVVHRGPALIAAITSAESRVTGVSCTWLAADGRSKAEIRSPDGEILKPRKIKGAAAGGHIELSPPAPVLLIGEGIETTLSAFQMLAGPKGAFWQGEAVSAWAGISLTHIAGGALGPSSPHPRQPDRMTVPSPEPDPGMPGIMPPGWAKKVILLGDGDSDPEITASRLECAARRFRRAGIPTMIAWAPRGADFNDALNSGRPTAFDPVPAGMGQSLVPRAA